MRFTSLLLTTLVLSATLHAQMQENHNDSVLIHQKINQSTQISADSLELKQELLFEALQIAENHINKTMKGMVQNSLAELYLRHKGQLDSALLYATAALKIFEKQPGQNHIRALNTIGLIYSYQEKTDKAIELYKEAWETYKSKQPGMSQAMICNNLGMNYGRKNEYEQAEYWYRKVIEISEAIKLPKGLLQGYNGLAAALNEQKKHEEALSYAQKALQYAQQMKHIPSQAIAHMNLGRTSFHLKNYKSALDNYLKAESIIRQFKDINKLKTINKQIGICYEKLGNFEQALKYKEIFHKLNDSIFNKEQAKVVAELQTKYETEKIKREKESTELENLKLATTNSKQRNMLLGALTFIVFAIILWILYARQQKIRKRAALTEVELKETQKRLLVEQQKRKAELKAVRAQLNPHFIFNVLNSVQEFIISGEKQKANETLISIARMMRKTLKNSEKEYISLKDELELVQLYLSAEKLRFEERLDYEIHLDQDIEEEFIKLPPMLIQPYVENAVKHGIKHKKEKGLVKILAKINTEDLLEITITDNGVGRQKAEELKKENREAHNTFSTKANEDRLQNIARETGKNAAIEIFDHTNYENQPTGTSIKLTIPIGL